MSWREQLETYVRHEARPVEKFGHQPRLYALTQTIGAGVDYDDDVVFAAAYLHDLGVFVGHRPEDPAALAQWDHVPYTLARTPAILGQLGFPQEKVAGVLECIRNHQPRDTPESLEATILRDADILEQLGAVGIVRTVCKVGRDTRFSTFTGAAASLERAVTTLPGMIRLQSAKELAEDRVRVLLEFLAALRAEADGQLF